MTETQAPSGVMIQRVVKQYGETYALKDVSLDIPAGSFTTLLGPSGSGKTTLLMSIAGFTRPDAGRILANGRDIIAMPPEKREFGMVFQGYALFPHLTVAGNVAFALKLRRRPRAEVQERVKRALDLVQLGHLADRYPRQLSGGQQQRVALARALVFEPQVLLLDEPLSALDKSLRADLQWELKALHARLGLTFVYVTHDQEEALSMSDQIAIIRGGEVVQSGAPSALYERPKTHFIASFLGRSNYVEGRVSGRNGTPAVVAGPHVLDLPPGADIPAEGNPVILAIRPEKIAVTVDSGSGPGLPGCLTAWSYLGASVTCRVATDLGEFHVQLPTWQAAFEPREGQALRLHWPPDAGCIVRDDR
ncbi:ABC transporter ATP-binding protein [Pseudoroseicyclus tamaricis]|uniref:ABC transporter ATP-binding protein n=1 Tax=Pseudoroseicyclus tamaricis TaxID=2705421 RepID=A0A6B2JR88_9RHOB|nr:ABC transporter ATP-binding protein [Pseudoroseicyclus tamaricis]NDV00505.1 ABC transporter ATP-binding protein [Pseudoroseicyclus tamaricis]